MRFALALSDSLFPGPRGLQKVPVRHIPKKRSGTYDFLARACQPL